MKTTKQITPSINQKNPLIKPTGMEKNSTISYTHLIHKVYNPTNSNIMKQNTKVSETVPAGEVAVEKTNLFNNSNSNKMSTMKKVTGKLLVFGVAFLMAAGAAKAQVQTVKSADAMEVVSAVPASAGISASLREVKSVIVVPEKLVKATKAAKDNRKKYTGKRWVRVQTVSAWYELNSTDETGFSDQTFSTGVPLTSAPDVSSGCAQNRTNGLFCAIHLTFPGSVAPTLDADSSVQDAMDDEDAELNTSEDGSSTDGYAQSPNL